MKYRFNLSNHKPLTAEQIIAVLPDNFLIYIEHDQLWLDVDFEQEISAESAFQIAQREFDRIFFLTGISITVEHYSIINENSQTIFKEFTVDATLVKLIESDIRPQNWSDRTLEIQLRLWQLARLPNLPIATKINLLFQIIEIAFPDTKNRSSYPPFEDSDSFLHPRTEAKFLRDLATHGKKDMKSKQLILYCKEVLRIRPEAHDPTSMTLLEKLRQRLPIIIEQARQEILKNISRNHDQI